MATNRRLSYQAYLPRSGQAGIRRGLPTKAHFPTCSGSAREATYSLLARAERGETVLITRAGRPIAELRPPAPRGTRQFGALRGLISIGPEFFEPLPDDDLYL